MTITCHIQFIYFRFDLYIDVVYAPIGAGLELKTTTVLQLLLELSALTEFCGSIYLVSGDPTSSF